MINIPVVVIKLIKYLAFGGDEEVIPYYESNDKFY